MAHITTQDGVKLHYEEAGTGTPIVFVHEFAGDLRSWEPQLRHFSRRYRCIAYNARGYPPSDVPQEAERYSQARAREAHAGGRHVEGGSDLRPRALARTTAGEGPARLRRIHPQLLRALGAR